VSRCSPFVVVLSAADRVVLEQRARAYTASFAQVVRAKIVLLAAQGVANAVIAARLDLDVDVVSRWRKRFVTEGLPGLGDRKRGGRPRSFPARVVAEVKAMACEPPQVRAVPLSRWSSAELAAQAVAEGLAVRVSASTVRRWLAEDAIKPWQYRSWIFPRDPNFAVKAARVLDLYGRVWDGVALGADEYVVCADEKSQLQALSRCHPELAVGAGRYGGWSSSTTGTAPWPTSAPTTCTVPG
jgi:transposase